jgi:hypothetical protein
LRDWWRIWTARRKRCDSAAAAIGEAGRRNASQAGSYQYIVHDLNPGAMSAKVKGLVSPQSWFVDLTLVSMQ